MKNKKEKQMKDELPIPSKARLTENGFLYHENNTKRIDLKECEVFTIIDSPGSFLVDDKYLYQTEAFDGNELKAGCGLLYDISHW